MLSAFSSSFVTVPSGATYPTGNSAGKNGQPSRWCVRSMNTSGSTQYARG